jgi:hypothetical protein
LEINVMQQLRKHSTPRACHPATQPLGLQPNEGLGHAGGQCWYVLGCDRKGKPIAEADEVPTECGVMVLQGERLEVTRNAPKRAVADLPFALWMVLAKATPLRASTDLGNDGPDQAMLVEQPAEPPVP